jgi:hypothetical protein
MIRWQTMLRVELGRSRGEDASGHVERHDPVRDIDDLADLQVAGGAARYPALI